MIDTDPEDGDLAQARHRIRVLEREHRELQEKLLLAEKRAATLTEDFVGRLLRGLGVQEKDGPA